MEKADKDKILEMFCEAAREDMATWSRADLEQAYIDMILSQLDDDANSYLFMAKFALSLEKKKKGRKRGELIEYTPQEGNSGGEAQSIFKPKTHNELTDIWAKLLVNDNRVSSITLVTAKAYIKLFKESLFDSELPVVAINDKTLVFSWVSGNNTLRLEIKDDSARVFHINYEGKKTLVALKSDEALLGMINEFTVGGLGN